MKSYVGLHRRGIVMSPDLGGREVVFVQVAESQPLVITNRSGGVRIHFGSDDVKAIVNLVRNRSETATVTSTDGRFSLSVVGDRVKISDTNSGIFAWGFQDFVDTLVSVGVRL